jgi:predicted dehydrogenase
MDDGAIGDINYIRGWIGNDGWHLEKDWFSDQERLGGGTLLDNGSHLLDIYRWFAGEVEECVGYAANTHHDVPMEDTALAIFEFSSGCHGFLQSSWVEWDDYMYMEINGSDGYIRIDNRLPDSEVVWGTRDGYQRRYEFSKLPPSSYDNEIDDYIDRVKRGEKPIPTGFDGLRAVQMAHGVYRSNQNREFVDLWAEDDEAFVTEIDGVEPSSTQSPSEGLVK